VSAPTGQKLSHASDLQHDGLAHGVIEPHRSLVVTTQGQGTVVLVSRLWVGTPGALPPWGAD
jgi:hypothetical protein